MGLVLCSTVLFGITPAVVSKLRGDMTLAELLAYRGLVAAPLLLLLARFAEARTGRRSHPVLLSREESWRVRYAGVFIGVFLYAPQLYLFYKAFDYIETSLAVGLGYIYPTLVIVIASARRRVWPSVVEISLGLVAIVGVAAITRTDSGSAVAVTGVSLVLAGAAIYAVYIVVAGDFVSRVSPLRLGAQVTGSVAAATAVGGLLAGSLPFPDQPRTWMFICIQGFLLVASTSLYYVGLERLGASHASLIDTAQPLFATLAGTLLLGERLGWIQIVGIALVMTSVLGTVILTQRRPALPFADRP